MRIFIALLMIATLVGCGEYEAPTIETPTIHKEGFIPARPLGDVISDAIVDTASGAWAVAQTPFEDIGIKKQPIPEILQQIEKNPYQLPSKISCDDIKKEITELDALLGDDICTPENQLGIIGYSKGQYIDQGTGMAREKVADMVSSKVNIIPFRSVVRRISGADKHVKKVERSYQAGRLRRAFLKGILGSLGNKCMDYCIIPAK